MKIIIEPTAQIVSRPQFIASPQFDIPDDGSDAVKLGAFAAKNCYDSGGKNGRPNETNQRQVIEHEHGSVLEHINYSIYITGVTRALSLESNRHRHLAISQRSTRYTAEEDACIVLEPFYADLWRRSPFAGPWVGPIPAHTSSLSHDEYTILVNFLTTCHLVVGQYTHQVGALMILNPLKLSGFDLRKWARGKARNILPHALETRITYTGNVRAWRWFIESRSDKHAEPEIRRLADKIYTVLRQEAPVYFDDFTCIETYDSLPVWSPTHSKV